MSIGSRQPCGHPLIRVIRGDSLSIWPTQQAFSAMRLPCAGNLRIADAMKLTWIGLEQSVRSARRNCAPHYSCCEMYFRASYVFEFRRFVLPAMICA